MVESTETPKEPEATSADVSATKEEPEATTADVSATKEVVTKDDAKAAVKDLLNSPIAGDFMKQVPVAAELPIVREPPKPVTRTKKVSVPVPGKMTYTCCCLFPQQVFEYKTITETITPAAESTSQVPPTSLSSAMVELATTEKIDGAELTAALVSDLQSNLAGGSFYMASQGDGPGTTKYTISYAKRNFICHWECL